MASIHRAVLNRIEDEWLGKMVGELEPYQLALIEAGLRGPLGNELMVRIEATNDDDEEPIDQIRRAYG